MDDHVELSCLLDYYGDFLTQRQRKLLELAVNEDYSLSEIAEREGISRQGARDAVRRGAQTLREMEVRLRIAGRTVKTRELLNQMALLIRERGSGGEMERLLMRQFEEIRDIWEGDYGV